MDGRDVSDFSPYTFVCAFQAGHHVRCQRISFSNVDSGLLAAKGQIPQW